MKNKTPLITDDQQYILNVLHDHLFSYIRPYALGLYRLMTIEHSPITNVKKENVMTLFDKGLLVRKFDTDLKMNVFVLN